MVEDGYSPDGEPRHVSSFLEGCFEVTSRSEKSFTIVSSLANVMSQALWVSNPACEELFP